ncbi:MAG: hypothetical protein CSA49_03760 [Gammaproteobacteria bacterium]|nr:MAG: hypothetical protein CSA49_03760 [Gammaproteobacteria bacterium]
MPEKNVSHLTDSPQADREPFIEENFSEDKTAAPFYPGGGRQALLDQLVHLSRYGSPLLLLTGEKGIGKTALINQLAATLDPAIYKLVKLDAEMLADEHFIITRLAEGFALDLGNQPKTAVNALVRYAKELDSYSQTPLLIIDNAQNLSSEAVTLLQLIITHAGSSGFRCLAAFDAERAVDIPLLSDLMASDLDFQEITVPLFDKAACADYLSYQIAAAGLGAVVFSPEQIEQVFHQSKGNPDKADILARQLLAKSLPRNSNRRQPFKLPVMPLFIAAVVAVLLAASYWFEDTEIPQPDEPGLSAETVAEKQQEKLSSEALAVDANMDEIDYNFEGEELEPVDVLQPVVAQIVKQKTEAVPASNSETDTVDAEALPSEKVVKNEVGQTKAVSTEPLPVETVSVKPAEITAVPVPVPAPAPANKPLPEFSQTEQRLLSLDSGTYTLQMLGAKEIATVDKFMSQYPGLKELAYYKTRRKAQDWFVVIYGQYSSKKQARQALTGLPASIQAARPWPRSIASVQNDIRKRNQ